MPVPFTEVVLLRSVGRAELLDGRRGLATVAVIVGGELTAKIGTQVLEAKLKRYGQVFCNFDQSRQRLVFCREEVEPLTWCSGQSTWP